MHVGESLSASCDTLLTFARFGLDDVVSSSSFALLVCLALETGNLGTSGDFTRFSPVDVLIATRAEQHLWCLRQFPRSVNFDGQNWQVYGFSPVWVLMWFLAAVEPEKSLLHLRHRQRVAAPALLPPCSI